MDRPGSIPGPFHIMANRKKAVTSYDVKTKADPVLAERYVPLRNSARQYRDTKTGAIISRNQRDKAVLPSRAGGLISKEALAKSLRERGVRSHMSRYQTLIEERRELLARAGIKASKREIRESGEMKNIIHDLRTKSNAARGRKARALVQLGLRDESWNWAVGETNENV